MALGIGETCYLKVYNDVGRWSVVLLIISARKATKPERAVYAKRWGE